MRDLLAKRVERHFLAETLRLCGWRDVRGHEGKRLYYPPEFKGLPGITVYPS